MKLSNIMRYVTNDVSRDVVPLQQEVNCTTDQYARYIGIDLVRSLQQRPLVIFTTAHKQFAIEGFELDAVDYLLKPIEFEPFSKAVNKPLIITGISKQPTNKTTKVNLCMQNTGWLKFL